MSSTQANQASTEQSSNDNTINTEPSVNEPMTYNSLHNSADAKNDNQSRGPAPSPQKKVNPIVKCCACFGECLLAPFGLCFICCWCCLEGDLGTVSGGPFCNDCCPNVVQNQAKKISRMKEERKKTKEDKKKRVEGN